MKIISVVGARPNFMKVAPLHRAFQKLGVIDSKLVHTGQHHDAGMSDVFFGQLDLPQSDYYLGVPSGSVTQQTAKILLAVEPVLKQEQPDWVVVVGDVTSTLACALAAAQQGIRVAHVEAGLRSGDRQMPEERNRILTDALADLLFVTEPAGCDNLQREGVPASKVHLVGNVMIDSLVQYRARASALNTVGVLGLLPGNYILVTMHRPATVDTPAGLERLVTVLTNTAFRKPVLFPVHPRTRANLVKFGFMAPLVAHPQIRLLEPQGYLQFLNLMEHAALVITDSGGVQEETTCLGVPCLTFRTSTERPITVERGTNQLITDLNPDTVAQRVADLLQGEVKAGQLPPLWDGQAAGRIARIISQQP